MTEAERALVEAVLRAPGDGMLDWRAELDAVRAERAPKTPEAKFIQAITDALGRFGEPQTSLSNACTNALLNYHDEASK